MQLMARQRIDTQRNFGVQVHSSLKVATQAGRMVRVYDMLPSSVGALQINVRKINVAALFRMYLEYCLQFWSPYYKKDVKALEMVQEVIKLHPGLEAISYKERLNRLVLLSLEP